MSLVPADSLAFDAVFQAYRSDEEPLRPDVAAEYAARMEFVHGCIDANLVLETPDPVIDTEFRYAKLRAAESIIAASLIMRPSGPMTRPNTLIRSFLSWAMERATSRRSTPSATSPAS